jgi:hypothetical protein
MAKLTPEDFQDIVTRRMQQIDKVLNQKAKEYSHNDDRLFNFNTAARINGVSVREAIWGMGTKHLVSVLDLVTGRLYNTEEMVDEKIGDLINYLLLLEGALWAERTQTHNTQPEKVSFNPDEFVAALSASDRYIDSIEKV